MANDNEADQNAILRGLIENVTGGELPRSGASIDTMAQLLAAAIAQVGQSIWTAQNQQGGEQVEDENAEINVVESYDSEGGSNIETTVEVPTSSSKKPICIKFPIELRKRIINMRKEGVKCKEIAKTLNVSVSGVQKVWERFLATGMVHDRKPSSYAGRPRKYTYLQDEPVSSGLETQYVCEGNMEVLQDSQTIQTISAEAPQEGGPPPGGDFITTSTPGPCTPGGGGANAATSPSDNPTISVIMTEDSSVFTENPLDMTGATVEIVETNMTPAGHHREKRKRGTPAYREELLLKLIEDCPLAEMRNMPDNSHVQNLEISVNKPLYMEYVLGHPFGKVPSPKPFDANYEEAQVILSDPVNPVGKELLSSLGYSTKVYFNACCKPSPLFDPQKVLASLPISLGPSHLQVTMQSVLQLLLDLCYDPVAALEKIPCGMGPVLVAHTKDGEMASHGFPPPAKLSEYWIQLYEYSGLLQCCDNFLSAVTPSAPCLLCHPFESFAYKLEIKDGSEPGEFESVSSPYEVAAPTISASTAHMVVAVAEAPLVTTPIITSVSCASGTGQFEEKVIMHRLPEASERQTLMENLELQVAQEMVTGLSGGYQMESSTLSNEWPTSKSSADGEEGAARVVGESECGAEKVSEQLVEEQVAEEQKQEEGKDGPSDSLQPSTSDSQVQQADSLLTAGANEEQQSESVITDPPPAPSPNRRSLRERRKRKQVLPTDSVPDEQHSTEAAAAAVGSTPKRKQSFSPPPSKRTRRAAQSKREKQSDEEVKHPSTWGVEEVADFIKQIHASPGTFTEHEVDGESLLSLDPEIMVKLMGVKTGPAIRIHKKINQLKEQFGIHAPSLQPH